MKHVCLFLQLIIVCCFAIHTSGIHAQAKSAKPAKVKKVTTTTPGPLFNDEEVLEFKLSGRLKEILRDRDGDTSTYFPMLLQYRKKDSTPVSIPLRVKSRGHFRRMREHCSMPPLMLNMARAAKLKATVFEKQDKLKLVTPCRGDEFVVREYLVYKLYNLISPNCMKARLAKVQFEDSLGRVKPQTQYCILIEDEERAAKRSGFFILNRKMVRMERVRQEEFTKLAVFQYMIGNTDWSVPYLHNIRLLYKDSADVPIAIPYDFDHSGIVSTPYALPPEQLNLTSVRQRRYRGICQDMANFEKTITLFNHLKEDIYKVYTSCTLLDAKYLKTTLKYLDEFYKTINNPKDAKNEFLDPCTRQDKIVISGYQD